MVKPIPHSHAAPNKDPQVRSGGGVAHRNFADIHAENQIPSGLPTNNEGARANPTKVPLPGLHSEHRTDQLLSETRAVDSPCLLTDAIK